MQRGLSRSTDRWAMLIWQIQQQATPSKQSGSKAVYDSKVHFVEGVVYTLTHTHTYLITLGFEVGFDTFILIDCSASGKYRYSYSWDMYIYIYTLLVDGVKSHHDDRSWLIRSRQWIGDSWHRTIKHFVWMFWNEIHICRGTYQI